MERISHKNFLLIFIILYIAVLGTVAYARHYNFETQSSDLGIFTQIFWNMVHGNGMTSSLEEILHHLGIHMSPFLYSLVPGYIIFQSPYYLLILQTIALALGALPLYFLALHHLQRKDFAILISAGYLLYPSLHWVNLFDFHEIAFFVPLFLAAFYFLEKKSWTWACIFLALAASTKEDAILAVLFTGIYLFVPPAVGRSGKSQKQEKVSFWSTERKIGLGIILTALAYFLISAKIVMPALGGGLLRLDRYGNLGGNMTEIITNLFVHPLLFFKTIFTIPKFIYIFWIFAPLVFIPFFAGKVFILLIPGMIENLLTTFGSQFSGLYQYDALLIPALFISAIYGLKKICEWHPLRVIWIKRILLAAFVITFLLRSPISPFSFPLEYFKSDTRDNAYRKMIQMVPEAVQVSAHTNLVPHISERESIYMLGQEPSPVDAVLIDGGDYFGFPTPEEFQKYADFYALSGKYNIQILEERYFVFIRK